MKHFLKNKKVLFLLKTLVSVGFVVWLIYKVQWGIVWREASHIGAWFLFLHAVLLLLGMFFSAVKWQRMATYRNFSLLVTESFRLYIAGTFLNNFFPSFVGGDTYRTLQLAKGKERMLTATATVVMDRVSGLWIAMALSTVFALVEWSSVISHPLWFFLAFGCGWGIFLTMVLVWWRQPLRWLGRVVRLFIPARVGQIGEEFSAFFHSDILWPMLGWSVVFNFFGVVLANTVLFWGLGLSLSLTQVASVIFLTSIIASLPVSVNGIGIKEWAYYTLFGFLGVGVETAITVALINRFVQMFVSFLAVPGFIRRLNKNQNENT